MMYRKLSIKKYISALSTGNISLDTKLSKALYTVNKYSKLCRDLKSDLYNNYHEISGDMVDSLKLLGLENSDGLADYDNAAGFYDSYGSFHPLYSDKIEEDIYYFESEISSLKDKSDEEELSEEEQDDLGFYEDCLEELEEIKDKIFEIKHTDVMYFLKEIQDNLYELKNSVLEKLISTSVDKKPSAYHKFPKGDVRGLYEFGDFTFHYNDVSEEMSESEYNSVETLNEISSENKLDEKISLDAAVNTLESYLHSGLQKAAGFFDNGRGRGYLQDKSMSVNARDAYDNGEMPLSKWTKKAILENVAYLNPDIDVSKYSLNVLKEGLLKSTAWHHTSPFYNATDFYSIDPKIENMNQAQVEEYLDRWKYSVKPKKVNIRDVDLDTKVDEILTKMDELLYKTNKYKNISSYIRYLRQKGLDAFNKLYRDTFGDDSVKIEKHNKNSNNFKDVAYILR